MAQLERATFENDLTKEIVTVMFNPAEVTVKKTVPWNAQAKPGQDTPKQQFTSGQARSISMKLDFDTSGLDGDTADAVNVSDFIDPLLAMANVPTDKEKAYPPNIHFAWGGSGLKFTCVMKSINVTYTRFNPDGVPTRSKVQVELLEVEPGTFEGGGGQVEAVEIVQLQEGQTVSVETAQKNDIDNPKKPGSGPVVQ